MADENLDALFDHLRTIGRRAGERLLAGDWKGYRQAVREYGAFTPACDAAVTPVSPVSAGDVPCEWLVDEDADPTRRLLYIHGGAWMAGNLDSHRGLASRISKATGCAVLTLDYRLAPEHPFPAGLDDCAAVYAWMLENGPGATGPASSVFIAGDSAGGNLTLAMLLKLRDENGRLPNAAVGLSPCTDFTASGDSAESRRKADPIIDIKAGRAFRQGYYGEHEETHPLISPLFGDLAGLPPVLLQVGDAETLLDDSTRFVEKAQAAGVDATCEVTDRMPHVFHFFGPEFPEAAKAIDRIGEFVRKHG